MRECVSDEKDDVVGEMTFRDDATINWEHISVCLHTHMLDGFLLPNECLGYLFYGYER